MKRKKNITLIRREVIHKKDTKWTIKNRVGKERDFRQSGHLWWFRLPSVEPVERQ